MAQPAGDAGRGATALVFVFVVFPVNFVFPVCLLVVGLQAIDSHTHHPSTPPHPTNRGGTGDTRQGAVVVGGVVVGGCSS